MTPTTQPQQRAADPAAAAFRHRDPRTSRFAAELAAEGFASKHRALVLACLRAHGPNGKTALGELTGLGDVAVARRTTELDRMGLIAPTGRYAQSDAGRLEREWVAIK